MYLVNNTKVSLYPVYVDLQSLIDRQIFVCVLNRPLGVVILQENKGKTPTE